MDSKGEGYMQDTWYRLDNSAVIYPISITTTTQSLFRLSCELNKYVDNEFLSTALKEIMPRFPTFNVLLRSGIFRYYFDHNPYPTVIKEDDGILFRKINFVRNNYYLFRVVYYRNKISIDFFHSLCDGTSAMEFMKAVVFQYLKTSGDKIESDGSVKLAGEMPRGEEELDSFMTYNTDYKLFGGVIGKMAGKKAFQLKGRRFRQPGYGLIEGIIVTDELKLVAKKYDCSITVLIAATAMLSVAEIHTKSYSKFDLIAMIPIDLRRTFPSETLKNFTSLAKCEINPNTTPPTLWDYCNTIKSQLADGARKEELAEKLSLSSFMSTKWYTKYMPLCIKWLVLRLGKLLSVRTRQTMIISNLGVLSMPSNVSSHVKNFSFNSNVSRKTPKNIGVVTYDGTTVISFTRGLVSTEIERVFFRKLSVEGISPRIISNFRELNKS
ncbi:MAG: hypothetical protein LBU04_02235 [Christensenellaceae bacterium]|nr:hypothetical protein [Christensenellaceae bacterium]